MSEPKDNHGSQANIGDLVKVYTDTGMETGVMGVIVEVRDYYSWSMEHWRKVRLHGKLDFIEDYMILHGNPVGISHDLENIGTRVILINFEPACLASS